MINMLEYSKMTDDYCINLVYNGPMRDDGVKSFAATMKQQLESDIIGSAGKAVFSVFIEQMTNILMYSAEKVTTRDSEEESPKGITIFGEKDGKYFIQTGNAMKNESIEYLKGKIDHLNSLDKEGLRKYHREKLKVDFGAENPESKGAGLGLIEMARRSSAPIKYSFEPYGEGLSYFSLYVEISQ
ncbi:MAG: SiaB family protein kinase [Oscillospiraceae bacterium]|nr:SiaB family protein kinase [Oscillospiraceae bacterium]